MRVTLEIPDAFARQMHLDGPESGRRTLIKLALDNHSKDNVTCLVIHAADESSLLLLRFVKKNPTRLRTLAVWIVIMRMLDVFWIVAPAFRQRGLEVYWTDLATLVGVGGIWLAFFTFNLKSRPLLASGMTIA